MALPVMASEPIPEHLVGIWASDDAVMKGPYLFEGAALYLDDDGTGAIVGGPPPIGLPISASFNSETKQIEFDIIENDQKVDSGRISYDPVSKTMFVEPGITLERRFEEFTDETKRGLGLKGEQ